MVSLLVQAGLLTRDHPTFCTFPTKMPVAICRFRHTYSGGTVADFHSLPYYFLKENKIISSKKPEILPPIVHDK
jgi:hypothetical protein